MLGLGEEQVCTEAGGWGGGGSRGGGEPEHTGPGKRGPTFPRVHGELLQGIVQRSDMVCLCSNKTALLLYEETLCGHR